MFFFYIFYFDTSFMPLSIYFFQAVTSQIRGVAGVQKTLIPGCILTLGKEEES